MDNTYVQMIIDARNKLKVSTTALCDGIYTADMFYMVEQGKRVLGRATAERLLARLGVDNGNYEHYLDYPDYESWRNRMKIINCIEDGNLEEAEELLRKYANISDEKHNSKTKIEKQFYIFMQLQIMKHKANVNDMERILMMYEKALKLTVPNIDKKPLRKMLLSQLELVLVLEYRRRKYANATQDEKWNMYEDLLEYIESSPLGKVSMVKVYPKVFVNMYKDMCPMINERYDDNTIQIYNNLFKYCEKALSYIRERKLMYYLTEILEIKIELLSWFSEKNIKLADINQQEDTIKEYLMLLDELKSLYNEYNINAYMVDDCYLYRESGIYCINEVIKVRRTMMGLTREELAGTDIELSTIWRVETQNGVVTHKIANKLFDRLNLFPSCVNTGIVTDKKEAVELYEELRYEGVISNYNEVKNLIVKLRAILPKHPINEQILLREESFNELRMGNRSENEHIETLKHALECTINLVDLQKATNIFITTEELTALYLVSGMYKEAGAYDKAIEYIDKIFNYCIDIEKEQLADGRMGIFELIMTYVASLYGDMCKYEESNEISEKLIKLCLKLRRGSQIHSNLYSIAWNNDNAKNSDYNYNVQVQRCINISRLLGDTFDEIFYRENMKIIE